MTGLPLTALATNPAPSPETGLISSVLYCPTFSSPVSRRFSNRSFYNRRFCGQERLELETLSEEGLDSEIAMLTNYLISRLSSFVYRQIIRSSSFRDYFLLKNI